jgi:cytochrome c oxidase cbb3-type subunit I
VHVWPRVTGRELYSFRLANWGYWLITAGISAMGLILTAQGLQQGFMLIAGAEWIDSLVSMHPFWWFRTFSGISMDVGMSLLLISLLRGPRSPAAQTSLARPAQAAT